jgi:hypothetical protein
VSAEDSERLMTVLSSTPQVNQLHAPLVYTNSSALHFGFAFSLHLFLHFPSICFCIFLAFVFAFSLHLFLHFPRAGRVMQITAGVHFQLPWRQQFFHLG